MVWNAVKEMLVRKCIALPQKYIFLGIVRVDYVLLLNSVLGTVICCPQQDQSGLKDANQVPGLTFTVTT